MQRVKGNLLGKDNILMFTFTNKLRGHKRDRVYTTWKSTNAFVTVPGKRVGWDKKPSF